MGKANIAALPSVELLEVACSYNAERTLYDLKVMHEWKLQQPEFALKVRVEDGLGWTLRH